MPLSSRVCAVTACLLAAAALPVRAQSRRSLDPGNPEAQLMGYYSAVMQFSPIGLPDRNGRLEIGGSLSLIPALSLQDRLVGFGGTKLEDSNLCPVFPRLTLAKGIGHIALELGWTPPIEVCGAKANVFAAAIGRRFSMSSDWDGFARASLVAGAIDASITCSESFTHNPTDETCYNGTPSTDRVAPLSVALDFFAGYEGWKRSRIEPYISLGFRYERVNFDVNYTRTAVQGALDPVFTYPALDDHERLTATLKRIQVAAGFAWSLSNRLKLGGELYYAPGAVITARGRASLVLGTP